MKNSDFILSREPNYTVSDYLSNIKNKTDDDKIKIAESIKRRLIQRYISPSEEKNNKSGFSIMANCCLLIETFESFYRGWNKTSNGPDTFCKFLIVFPNFQNLQETIYPQFFIKI